MGELDDKTYWPTVGQDQQYRDFLIHVPAHLDAPDGRRMVVTRWEPIIAHDEIISAKVEVIIQCKMSDAQRVTND